MTNSPALEEPRPGGARAHLIAVMAFVLTGAWQPLELADAEDPSGQPLDCLIFATGHDAAAAAGEQPVDLNPVERTGFARGAPRFLPSSWRLAMGRPALARIGGRLRGRHA